MKISILTLCPEAFDSFLRGRIIARAIDRGIADIRIVDIRPFAGGSFRHIDDSPIGGGAGMILRPAPMLRALDTVQTEGSFTAALTPSGLPYSQAMAHELAGKEHLILLCGHFEGMDARILKRADREISVGDYVLSGGELPAMTVTDSIVRLLPGILRPASTQEESFETGLLEYPQYTQPADYEGDRVPDVLLSGNHEAVRRWRLEQSVRLTKERRPDLWERARAQYPEFEDD